MATPRASRSGTGSDEEFQHRLNTGGDLLQSGKIVEAKDHLEAAFKLQPKNEKAQNLLGLTYFKLGLFDRASEIYELLTKDNPVDPTLRVNLGLSYLKTNAVDRAIHEFEVAVDLAPEHKKAQNYLGVALAQAGQYAKAREHFLLAGSDAMADKMARALATEKTQPAAPPPSSQAPAPSYAPPSRYDRAEEIVIDPMPDQPPPLPAGPTRSQKDWAKQFVVDEDGPKTQLASVDEIRAAAAAPPGLRPVAAPAAAPPPPATPPQPVVHFSPAGGDGVASRPEPWKPIEPQILDGGVAAKPISEVAASSQVFAEAGRGPFQVKNGVVLMSVRGELLTRLTGLSAMTGPFEFLPENKRFRGKATDKPFGEGDEQVVRLKGEGLVVTDARESNFVPLALGDDSAYFREDVVFAFQEVVAFENGRVPSDVADLELVHLRGKGMVLLRLVGELRSIGSHQDSPVIIPLDQLVGWIGNLSPRVLPLVAGGRGRQTRAGVELTGEGFALFVARPKS